MLVLLNVGGLFRNEVMGDKGRLCVTWLFSLSQVSGVEALKLDEVLGTLLGGVTYTLLAEPAGVVIFRIDLALQMGVLKLALAPLEDLPGVIALIAELGGVVDLRIVLVCVVALTVDGVIAGNVGLTAEPGRVVCLRLEVVGDVALTEELGMVLDLWPVMAGFVWSKTVVVTALVGEVGLTVLSGGVISLRAELVGDIVSTEELGRVFLLELVVAVSDGVTVVVEGVVVLVTQAGDFAASDADLLGLVPLPEGVAPLQEILVEVESVVRYVSITLACSRVGVTGSPGKSGVSVSISLSDRLGLCRRSSGCASG